MSESKLFPLAIALTVLALGAHYWLSRLPDVKPESAPATEFSAARATRLLDHLLQENEPHPLGSEANMKVRSRIVTWLDDNGIENEIQSDWGCASKHNSCGWVENIIAVLPGSEAGRPYVALMAHYDSVPMAPGAGDDGAGVVAVLETVRALKAHGPLPNPVLLIITDGEEAGLLGAEAFFKFHPLAKKIGVLMNVEGSGTTGPSMVLRTAMDNATFMRHFGDVADHPFGSSLANEVFRRMPNDTDFSVSMRAKVPGIDFAFSAERNHYHTPNDNVANLNPRTVQHHGENLLPTALRLAGDNPGQSGQGNVLYSGAYGAWIQWPSGLSIWLLGLAGLLLLVAAHRLPGSFGQLAVTSTLVPLAIIVCSSLLTFLLFKAVGLINGTTVSWPAHLWPFRLVLFATMLTMGLVISGLANRKIPLFVVLLGSWFFWWLLTLLLVVMVPGAANVLLIPLLPASVLLCIAARAPLKENTRKLLYLLTLVLAVPLLAMAILLEQTQGYRLVVATFVFIALYSVAAGAFVRGRWLKPAVKGGMALVLAGMIAASVLPLYSEWRPQHINIHYIESTDQETAYWRLRSPGPAPGRITALQDFSVPELQLYPWTSATSANMAQATVANLSPPDLTVLSDEITGDGRRVRLKLHSNRSARFLQLALPANTTPVRYRVGGNEVDPLPSRGSSDRGVFRFVFLGVQSRDVEVTIDFEDNAPVTAYLLDVTTELPPQAAPMLAARPPLASPVHAGDMAMVFKRVEF